ncbi:unnamed protein product [Alternaria alternata]
MAINTHATAKPAKPTPLDWKTYWVEKKKKKAQEQERKRKREEDAQDVPPAQKKSRNVRRRIKQADAENKAAAEEEAAEWRSTRSKPDFGDCDKKKKPQITLPLRGAASSNGKWDFQAMESDIFGAQPNYKSISSTPPHRRISFIITWCSSVSLV